MLFIFYFLSASVHKVAFPSVQYEDGILESTLHRTFADIGKL